MELVCQHWPKYTHTHIYMGQLRATYASLRSLFLISYEARRHMRRMQINTVFHTLTLIFLSFVGFHFDNSKVIPSVGESEKFGNYGVINILSRANPTSPGAGVGSNLAFVHLHFQAWNGLFCFFPSPFPISISIFLLPVGWVGNDWSSLAGPVMSQVVPCQPFLYKFTSEYWGNPIKESPGYPEKPELQRKYWGNRVRIQ